MNFKTALLLFLVFASTLAATAVVFSTSTLISFPSRRETTGTVGSYMQPLGDPIDGSDPPTCL